MTRSQETNLQASIMIALSEAGCRVWRNNVGQAKTEDGRFIAYGVGGKGAADLLGMTPTGHFLSIEVKTPTGRVSPEQQHFVDMVNAAGGRAGIARSPEEAVRIALGDRPDNP
jgi:hypothetical protein